MEVRSRPNPACPMDVRSWRSRFRTRQTHGSSDPAARAPGEEKFARSSTCSFEISVDGFSGLTCRSNLTGHPVFFCRTVALSTAYPLGAMSSTLRATTSLRPPRIYLVTSMAAPAFPGWSSYRVGLTLTGKRHVPRRTAKADHRQLSRSNRLERISFLNTGYQFIRARHKSMEQS